MGTWHIHIKGTGVHHNHDLPEDANKLAAQFVEQLAAKGHTIHAATFEVPNAANDSVSVVQHTTKEGKALVDKYGPGIKDDISNPDAYINRLNADKTARVHEAGGLGTVVEAPQEETVTNNPLREEAPPETVNLKEAPGPQGGRPLTPQTEDEGDGA